MIYYKSPRTVLNNPHNHSCLVDISSLLASAASRAVRVMNDKNGRS